MAQAEETRLTDWLDQLGSVRGPGSWYVQAYFWLGAYLIIPIIAAAVLNKLGLMQEVWMLGGVLTLVDVFLLFYPWSYIGFSLAGFIAGQLGGKPGPSIQDGVAKTKDWAKGVFVFGAAVILGKHIAIVTLGILPVEGNEGVIAVILGVILPVIIGNIWFSERPWVIRFFYGIYVTILVVALAYWIIVTIWPNLRHSAAYSVARKTERSVVLQNDSYMKREMERIDGIINAMDPKLQLEERIKVLKPEDRALWEKANSSSFAGKTTRSIGERLRSVSDDVRSALPSSSDTSTSGMPTPSATQSPTTTAPATGATAKRSIGNCLNSYEGPFRTNEKGGAYRLGTFCPGNYTVTYAGSRMQFFNPAGEPEYFIRMDCSGNDTSKGRIAYEVPEAIQNAVPLEAKTPYGLCLLWAGTESNPQQRIAVRGHGNLSLTEETVLTAGNNVVNNAYKGVSDTTIKISKL